MDNTTFNYYSSIYFSPLNTSLVFISERMNTTNRQHAQHSTRSLIPSLPPSSPQNPVLTSPLFHLFRKPSGLSLSPRAHTNTTHDLSTVSPFAASLPNLPCRYSVPLTPSPLPPPCLP